MKIPNVQLFLAPKFEKHKLFSMTIVIVIVCVMSDINYYMLFQYCTCIEYGFTLELCSQDVSILKCWSSETLMYPLKYVKHLFSPHGMFHAILTIILVILCISRKGLKLTHTKILI